MPFYSKISIRFNAMLTMLPAPTVMGELVGHRIFTDNDVNVYAQYLQV